METKVWNQRHGVVVARQQIAMGFLAEQLRHKIANIYTVICNFNQSKEKNS